MSKKFVWTKKYSVNVKEIDGQHKEFIKICNSLADLASSKSFTDEEALIKVMQLGDYIAYHFAIEEELFIRAKYTEESLHVKIHNKFRKKVNQFIN